MKNFISAGMTTPPRRSRRLAQLQPDEIQGDVVDTKNAAGKSAAHSSVESWQQSIFAGLFLGYLALAG